MRQLDFLLRQQTTYGANKQGSDEWYTPAWAVNIIADRLTPQMKILCPFDTEESEFYKILTARGHKVTTSHISEQQNFFEQDLTGYDFIVSNPPYSLRDKILTVLYEQKRNFALLLSCNGLFDSKKRVSLAASGSSFIFIYPRIAFINCAQKEEPPKKAPFTSVYWTRGLLPDGSVEFWMPRETDQIQINE